MTSNFVPAGMNRRHFMSHLAGASALAGTAMSFTNSMALSADTLKKNKKACILMWMSGGPPTIDIWDLKPGSKNGGEFKPISTSGDLQNQQFLDLGRLRSFEGSQRYSIPPGTDLSRYASVIIWCEQFSVLISPADLKAGS